MHEHFRAIIQDVDEALGRHAVETARTSGSFIDFAGTLRGHTSHSDADLRAAFAAALLDENILSLTARQGQALFEALEVQALRWDYLDDGCHARALLAGDELLPAWGVPPTVIGRAWLFSTQPAGWGFDVEDRFAGPHSWSQHTAPTVQVESSSGPTVLDPALFSCPVALSTWAGRFNLPGAFAVFRATTPPPIPAAMRHYLKRILQGGQSTFDKVSPEMKVRLWTDPQARQQLLAAGISPPAVLPSPEVQSPRLMMFTQGLSETYHAACARVSQQGSDGLVIHTNARQGPFSDVPSATVAHPDFLRLHPGLEPAGLARLYLAALGR